jgi:hypothetical protein
VAADGCIYLETASVKIITIEICKKRLKCPICMYNKTLLQTQNHCELDLETRNIRKLIRKLELVSVQYQVFLVDIT